MRAERANSNCGGRRGKGCGCSWTQHWALLPAAPSDTARPIIGLPMACAEGHSIGGTGLRITPDTGLASRHPRSTPRYSPYQFR